jgi:hypothetical protein
MEKAKKVWNWYESWFDAYPRGGAIAFAVLFVIAIVT